MQMQIEQESKRAMTWAATSIGLSASLYLFSFGTTLNTLWTYYQYKYQCPHASLASSIVQHDPICHAIKSNQSLHSFASEFWMFTSILALAHLTYALVFWLTLDPHQHPLRLAYFMPLIHLYRLLKLVYHTFTCEGIKQLQDGQRESSSLYNVVGAALETTPQFIAQFHIIMKLGEYVKGSSDPNMQALRVPTSLLLSLAASLASGVYGATMAVLPLMEGHMRLTKKVCLSGVVGCQALAIMILKANLYSALAQFADPGTPIIVFIYSVIGLVIAWSFGGFLLRTHSYSYEGGKKKMLRVAHSFGIALIILFIGPMYMIVKLKRKSTLLIWGIFLHICGDVLGLSFVILRIGNMKDGEAPCHSSKASYPKAQSNHYLTCHLFLGSTMISLLLLILTTMLFVMFHLDGNHAARVSSETCMDISNTQRNEKPSLSILNSRLCIKPSKHLENKQKNSIFKILLLFVLMCITIQKHLSGLHTRLVHASSSATKEVPNCLRLSSLGRSPTILEKNYQVDIRLK